MFVLKNLTIHQNLAKKFKDYEYIFIFIIGWIFAKIWQFLIFSSARLGISVRIYDVFCSAPLWWKKNNCYRAIDHIYSIFYVIQFGRLKLAQNNDVDLVVCLCKRQRSIPTFLPPTTSWYGRPNPDNRINWKPKGRIWP